jgi:hypothetical protein
MLLEKSEWRRGPGSSPCSSASISAALVFKVGETLRGEKVEDEMDKWVS